MKSRLAAVAATLALSMVMTGTFSAADAAQKPAETSTKRPASAVGELKEQLAEAAAEGEPGARRELRDLNALSAKQQQIVAQVADAPALVELIASGSIDPVDVQAVSPYLQVTEETGNEIAPVRVAVRKVTYTTTSWHLYSYSVLGVTITKVRQDFTYERNGISVTKLLECRHSSTNYAPTRSISGRTTKYLSNGKGYCNTVWRISYGIYLGPISASVGHKEATQKMTVYGNGSHSSSFD